MIRVVILIPVVAILLACGLVARVKAGDPDRIRHMRVRV